MVVVFSHFASDDLFYQIRLVLDSSFKIMQILRGVAFMAGQLTVSADNSLAWLAVEPQLFVLMDVTHFIAGGSWGRQLEFLLVVDVEVYLQLLHSARGQLGCLAAFQGTMDTTVPAVLDKAFEAGCANRVVTGEEVRLFACERLQTHRTLG
jgi:hypothetical protein